MKTAQETAVPDVAAKTHDGFDVLDVCHRQTIFSLGRLASLVAHLEAQGVDHDAGVLAHEVVDFFSKTSRQHHEDEEKHVFPKLLAAGDEDLIHAVQRLQQDHGWLEADWNELEPMLDAIASGQSFYEIEALHNSVDVFTTLMHEHIALEESIVYPEARERATGRQRQEMWREMTARRRARHPE